MTVNELGYNITLAMRRVKSKSCNGESENLNPAMIRVRISHL
jgi:hypothetical protein